MLAGMRDQTFPRDQFEVIFVDHRYERRHVEVMDLAKRYDVPLIHVPEHRRNGRWGCTASAFNTGFAVARGEIVIMLVDWTYAPPGWIETHLNHHTGQPSYVVGLYLYHAVGVTEPMYHRITDEATRWSHLVPPWTAFSRQPKLRVKIPFDLTTQDARFNACSTEDAVLRGEVFDEISAFEDGLFDPKWIDQMPEFPVGDPGLRRHMPGMVVEGNQVHLKNESILRDPIYALNGIDVWGERGGRMQVDTDFGLRVARLGIRLVWDPAAVVHCINPRHGVCRMMPFGDPVQRMEGRWSQADCEAFALRREIDIRLGQFLAAPAPYTMRELAKRLEKWRTAGVIDTAELDIPDTEFFGREIWPDSPYT